MAEVTATLIHHRKRLNEIARVLVHHGLAAWAARGAGIAGVEPVEHLINRVISPDELEMSEGQRLRGALTELGTTFIKFGQMLSLRPDVVGEDIATELAKLQASVPPDPPGVAQATVEADLGRPVAELYGSFEPEAFASGSVAQVHRATLRDGTPVAVKVLHDGADTKVRDDVELMRGDRRVPRSRGPAARPAPADGHRGRVRRHGARRHRPRSGAGQPAALPVELRRRARRGRPDPLP